MRLRMISIPIHIPRREQELRQFSFRFFALFVVSICSLHFARWIDQNQVHVEQIGDGLQFGVFDWCEGSDELLVGIRMFGTSGAVIPFDESREVVPMRPHVTGDGAP